MSVNPTPDEFEEIAQAKRWLYHLAQLKKLVAIKDATHLRDTIMSCGQDQQLAADISGTSFFAPVPIDNFRWAVGRFEWNNSIKEVRLREQFHMQWSNHSTAIVIAACMQSAYMFPELFSRSALLRDSPPY